VVDHELLAPFEQVGEAQSAVHAVKHVGLRHLDHRQAAALRVQLVAGTGEGLLFGEQALA
jgi:hypothetical protein